MEVKDEVMAQRDGGSPANCSPFPDSKLAVGIQYMYSSFMLFILESYVCKLKAHG
jgi:hypothetical protein